MIYLTPHGLAYTLFALLVIAAYMATTIAGRVLRARRELQRRAGRDAMAPDAAMAMDYSDPRRRVA